MADKEWRVAAKALYIVHRFAADGSIEHASNLKESVAVLRTHHDSRRKVRRPVLCYLLPLTFYPPPRVFRCTHHGFLCFYGCLPFCLAAVHSAFF